MSGNNGRTFKLTENNYQVLSQRMRGCITVLRNMLQRYFINETHRESGIHHFDRVLWKVIRNLPMKNIPLSPSSFLIYLPVYYWKILHSAHTQTEKNRVRLEVSPSGLLVEKLALKLGFLLAVRFLSRHRSDEEPPASQTKDIVPGQAILVLCCH
jgi:hypothetical protein